MSGRVSRSHDVRIVSLLPSATEIICELGLGDQLVAVSHECDYPPRVRQLPKVTRTLIPPSATSREIDTLVREQLRTQGALYQLDLPMLARLQPDLIVTQELCGVCAVNQSDVAAAASALSRPPQLVNLRPRCLDDVLDSFHLIGQAAGAPDLASAAVARLRSRIAAVTDRTRQIVHPPRVVLLEWIDPPFCAGHWSPELVRLAGGVEAIGHEGQPSRTIAWEEVLHVDPEALVLALCGLDVERAEADLPQLATYPGFNELACVRAGRVHLFDGSAYFNRPGPRLVDSLELLAHALHPQVHPLPLGPPSVSLTGVRR